jgi:site-specific DNA-methyltransferase (adenine-specific)
MSQSVDWATPQAMFDELNREFQFDYDPCPLYAADTMSVDGLSSDWGNSTFCNPPYGRTLGLWTRKAREQAALGKTVVLLIPSRTDTKWWHEDVMLADEIRFVRGRLKFGGAPYNAPFPSAVVVFRGRRESVAA